MTNIRTRESLNKKAIRVLNKSTIITEKTKDSLVNIKNKVNISDDKEQNEIEYGSNKIKQSSEYLNNKMLDYSNRGIKNVKNKFIKIKNREQLLSHKKKSKCNNTKLKKEVIKNTTKSSKKVVKASQNTIRMMQKTTKVTIKTLKIMIKGTISAVKGIIEGTKALISAIIAGGWIAVIIILIICMVCLLCSSTYGIFLSNESVGKNTITMKSVIRDINTDVSNKIEQIKNQNQYDDYEVISYQSEWKNVLAIYVAQVSKGKNESDVMTLSIEKVNLLKKIFWEMNEITSSVEEKTSDMLEQNSKKKILTITIKGKSISEMETKYMFNQSQKLQVYELLKKEYDSLWNSILYGSTIGNSNMSQIAANEIGNKGGEKYWSWYGFESRIEWCAVFVSWVANQIGYIDSGIIPKFTTCHTQGVPWFKNRGQWQEKGYIPKSGDIIFLDWQQDGYADHVGIVEYVENNEIYTIEGNLDDEVKKNKYSINSKDIYGYGTIIY